MKIETERVLPLVNILLNNKRSSWFYMHLTEKITNLLNNESKVLFTLRKCGEFCIRMSCPEFAQPLQNLFCQ